MRILVAHNTYQQPGGEDAVFAAETALLRRYGHEVVEYTEDNRRINEMSRLAVAAQAIWSGSSRQRLFVLLRDVRPNVAQFHNTFLLISPSVYSACREVRVPVVQTLHNYRLLCPRATFFWDGDVCEDCLSKTSPWPGVLRACYRGSRSQTAVVAMMLTFHRWLKTWQKQVDLYIALTEFARQKFIEGGLPAEKIVVKPNFVNHDPGVSEVDGRYALFVGRLSPEKGVRTLLEAWKKLKGVPLKVVGDGPLMAEVRMQAGQLPDVEVLGRCYHQEVVDLLKEAKFLVFSSEWYEGFPMVIAEAFACGLPVIASRLGAMAEIIEDGKTGLFFTPGDSENLAEKVGWLWSRPNEIKRMGKEERKEYERKYTAEKNYGVLMEIYQKAISSSRE